MWLRDRIIKAIEIRRKTYFIKKEQCFFQQILRGSEYRGTEVVFNQQALAWLVVIVTVFLQVISLATTYEGSKVYFGGIVLPLGLGAPLLFALAIQSIVFAMSHVIRRYFRAGLVMILMLATLCSTYFSYIGIYNHINSPIDYLEERYIQIYDNMTKQYQSVIDRTEQQMKSYVFDLVGVISGEHTRLSKKIEENQELEKMIKDIDVGMQTISPQVNALAKPNKASYGDNIDQYYIDMRSYNAALGGMISDTTTQGADLANTLRENEVKARLGGKSQEEFIHQNIQVETSKEQMEKTVDAMYILVDAQGQASTFDEKLASLQSYCLNFIIQNVGVEEHFSTILTNFYTVVNEIETTKDFKAFNKDLGYFMLFNEEKVMLMKDLPSLTKEVYEQIYSVEGAEKEIVLNQEDAMLLYTSMHSEIKRAAYELNQMKVTEETIDLNESNYTMHNLYVLPINNLLVKSDIRPMAWFCLGFAVLIDGLTLLFAIMQGREKTLLFARTNKEAIGKSKEGIEELLLTTIIDNYIDHKSQNVVESVCVHLTKFLGPFQLMPEGIESGYSMWCPISKLDTYSVFIAVLCQFNLAVILGREDLGWLQETEEFKDERYVLLKTKFIIWAKRKITDLVLKQDYIDAVRNVEQELQVEGESV